MATTSTTSPLIASFSNDSGVVGDDITNDNTQILAGTAAAYSTVKVFDGTTSALRLQSRAADRPSRRLQGHPPA